MNDNFKLNHIIIIKNVNITLAGLTEINCLTAFLNSIFRLLKYVFIVIITQLLAD